MENKPNNKDIMSSLASIFGDPQAAMDDMMEKLDQRFAELAGEDDPFATNPLLTEKEGFCPITLILNGEDNSDDILSFTQGNRSLFNKPFNEIVKYRMKAYKMKQLLQSPLEAFQTYPDILSAKVGKKSLDSLRELAEIPGIDAHEIVRYANDLQVANARKTLKLEAASSMFRYLPSKNLVSLEEYRTARSFLKNYIESNIEFRKDFVRINSIGIPAGLIKSQSSLKQIKIEEGATFFHLSDQPEFQPRNIEFHPNIFILPGSLPDSINGEISLDAAVFNSKYFISSKNYDKFADYSEVVEWMSEAASLNKEQIDSILMNHVLDFCIQTVLKVSTGLNFNEDTFRLNKLTNKQHITSRGLETLEALLSDKIPPGMLNAEGFNGDEDSIPDVKKIFDNFPTLTSSEINTFLAMLECRLITPETIAKKCLSPRIFDRVFCVLSHPSQHYILDAVNDTPSQHNLYLDQNSSDNLPNQSKPNPEDKIRYKVILDNSQISSMASQKMLSHMASYFYILTNN